MNRQPGKIGLYLVLIVMLVAGYFYLNNQVTSQSNYTMEELQQAAEDGKVTSASLYQNREVPTGSVVAEIEGEGQKKVNVTDVNTAQEILEKYDIHPDVKGCSAGECFSHNVFTCDPYRSIYPDPVCHDEQTDVRRGRQLQDDEFWQEPCKDDASGRQKSNFSERSRSSGREGRSGGSCGFPQISTEI